jgi:6-pyruvoyltetrahydropterin/6-carboxytetrahydropterin synthase
MILSIDDADMLSLFCPEGEIFGSWQAILRRQIVAHGHAATSACRFGQKLYVIAPQPTAECLARHWFDVLALAVRERSEGHAELILVRVEETPNCWATFGPGFLS